MSAPVLTVVIAAKDAPPLQLRRCIASFAALTHAPHIEIVLVQSGMPSEPGLSWQAPFHAARIIDTPPNGVYAAFNLGIEAAKGRYLLFFGTDDLALPEMDAVLAQLAHGSEDLHAAACYMQGRGVLAPSMQRRSLIRQNWCQQGIFYSAQRIKQHRFDLRYKVQADHKLNIDLLSDVTLRFSVSAEPVAYFSRGGASSTTHDIQFIRDFPQIVTNAYGWRTGAILKLRQRVAALARGSIEERYGRR